MNSTRTVAVGLALLALVSTAPAFVAAQEESRAQTQTPPAATPARTEPPAPTSPPRNVQVEVTIALQGGGSTPVSKKMTLVAGDRQVALGRSGIEVAVQTQPGPAVSYRSVGLNVDARPQLQSDNRIGLSVKLTFSTILKREPGETGPPSFGNSSTELNLVLESGRPIVVAQAADAELGRGYSVEVKATILK
jgi:hypothetical protein